MILTLDAGLPEIAADCFVAENAVVVGDVRIGSESSIWFGASVRGDMASITVGQRTNVQDQAVLHVDTSKDLKVGNEVTIGHGAIVHACTVRDRVLIGMGAVIMNDAEIGEDCIIGAGSVVTEGAVIPPRSLVLGVPGKVRRELTSDEVLHVAQASRVYVQMARRYIASGLQPHRDRAKG